MTFAPTTGSKASTHMPVVNHAVKYVDGRVHTNGLENFWSLLKRGLNGTYVSVEPYQPVPVSRRRGIPL